MAKDTKTLDVTGMTCPMPLIQIRARIDEMSPGDQIEIVGDDPVFEVSMRDFCQENTHTILCVDTDGRRINMRIEK